MAILEIKDRADQLFGREADLAALRARAGRTGLTAIVGPPQIGKSWLLMELANRLVAETDPNFCVGFTRSPRGAPDPLLQVVSDLYQRWLPDARALAVARLAWDQQKDRLPATFAKFVGKLSEKAAKLVPGVGDLLGTAIKESLDGLIAASEDLGSGRLVVARLEYGQAQELVSSVHQTARRPIALVMDQWEETGNLAAQATILRDFLREPEQWPGCHIFVGIREGSDAETRLADLTREFPDTARVHKLTEMDLSDAAERNRLVAFLRTRVPGIWDVADDDVLALVDGYPRVIARWIADEARDTARTLDGLRRLVKDSVAFRYADLEPLLRGLDGDRRRLAIRIALIPLVEDPEAWAVLRPIVMAGLDRNALDDLKLANILDKDADCPRFGHAKRRDAVQTFLDATRPEAMTTEGGDMALGLARSITTFTRDAVHFVSALRDLPGDAGRRRLDPLPRALQHAAMTLLGADLESPTALVDGVREVRRSAEPGIGLVLAVGLKNTLHNVKVAGDHARRNALLEEMRALVRVYPNDAPVREQLADGLFNTIGLAKRDGDLAGRDALLEKLRDLARAYSNDSSVRLWLAEALVNTRNDAKAESDLGRRDALLDELRDLARAYPDDAPVREQRALGLCNTLIDLKTEDAPARRDALLEELRDLARAHPDDSSVRGWLAKALFSTRLDAATEGDLARLDTLLEELRSLARAYPDDTPVRQWLTRALFNTLVDAMAKDDLARYVALLEELDGLAGAHPDDALVREAVEAAAAELEPDTG